MKLNSLEDAAIAFENLADRIVSVWKGSFADSDVTLIASQGYPHLPLSTNDIVVLCNSIADRIRVLGEGKTDNWEDTAGFNVLEARANTIVFANFANDPNAVVKSTVDFLLWASSIVPPSAAQVDWENVSDKDLLPKKLAARLKSLDLRIAELEPRALAIKDMIDEIEAAREAADQLPTDMEELRRVRVEMALLLEKSVLIEENLKRKSEFGDACEIRLLQIEKVASHTVERSEVAYRTTTSAGLAGAFTDRSNALNKTGWLWVAILAVSLISVIGIGAWRLGELKSLLGQNSSESVLLFSAISAMLSIGAPVWLAWLATRNIGQTFRLAEDYAFKASVSKAYEGYRREAISLDGNFAGRLFGSALDRLDELPSRFMKSEEYNSPVQELLQNDSFKTLLKQFPDAAEGLKQTVYSLGESSKSVMRRVAPIGTTTAVADSSSTDITNGKA